jgi:FeS assembly SUF system regulator
MPVLSFSRKTDYALMALAELAMSGAERLSARELADRCGIALPVLRNLLKAMARGGLLESSFGAVGGYHLAVPAREITVMRVIESVDGPVSFARCCDDDAETCRLEQACRIRWSIRGVNERIVDILRTTTIEDLLHSASDDRVPLEIAGKE